MLTPAEAEAAIAATLSVLPAETVALERAAGRVLREALYADRDQPPFDRVAMDGIAFASAAYAAGRREFRIAGVVAAGAKPAPLNAADTCLEVMTGAVLPPGSDTVVPVEDLTVESGSARLAASVRPVPYGNVHRQGTDGLAGACVLEAGVRLRGPELAIAAASGRTTLAVTRMPRIAVLSTGDELVPPGTTPAPWQVRRSNAYGIAATLREHGYDELSDAHAADDPGVIRDLLERHLETHDVLVLSGGVSAGRFDHVPAALAAAGVRQVFHRVAQRPGKPFWFGGRADGRLAFALPGNPVSTLVCLVRYVLPALARLTGTVPPAPVPTALSAAFEARHPLATFLPVDRPPGGDARLVAHPTHGSGDFTALAGTVGFVELAAGLRWEPGSLAPLYTW
jgi:molybdopterin molybdotransferase